MQGRLKQNGIKRVGERKWGEKKCSLGGHVGKGITNIIILFGHHSLRRRLHAHGNRSIMDSKIKINKSGNA